MNSDDITTQEAADLLGIVRASGQKQRMPARALRRRMAASMRAARRRSETKNAREGIETKVTQGTPSAGAPSETKNAREGIETYCLSHWGR